MADLNTLRPEVRDALFNVGKRCDAEVFDTLTAELLRLAEDAAMFAHAVSLGQRYKQRAETAEAELLRLAADRRRADVIRDSYMTQLTQTQLERGDAIQRAEKAEAELATAQNTINAQQDTIGALKQKLALSEGELAALKARIAEAPVVYLTSKTGVGPCNVASMAHDVVFDSSCTYGKSVRVVLDE